MRQDESQEYKPQLFLRKYALYNNTFAHCLICSTAPLNAENEYREDLPSKKTPNSGMIKAADYLWQTKFSSDSWKAKASSDPSCQIDDIKSVLQDFIKEKWGESGKDVLSKISIILDIHGFNVPLKNLEKNTYEPLSEKFKNDVTGKTFEDFVIVINFSWPSEQVIASQWREFQAIPIVLWILIGISITLLLSNIFSSLALILVGMSLLLILLRLVVYFRDRDRATNYGVFDAVDLVRWIQVILEEILLEATVNNKQANEHQSYPDFFGRANLSFTAHSMGCFVATHTIRVLSDVFDPYMIDRWKKISPNGPFETEPKSTENLDPDQRINNIGNLFTLKTLVIASPDIPIWAITTRRSNFLKSCLRRFKEIYLFSNDADMVLRLASTTANYFIFPSKSRVGGYRLGNLTITKKRVYGISNLGNDALGVRAFTHNISLQDEPFSCKTDISNSFTIVDCTDYKDKLIAPKSSACPKRLLSAFTANNSFATFFNYIFTAFRHFSGICQIDSHGGYFRGKFCRDLIYSLSLYGKQENHEKFKERKEILHEELRKRQMAWIESSDDKN